MRAFCVLTLAAVASGYQLLVPRFAACVRAPAPVAGLFDNLFSTPSQRAAEEADAGRDAKDAQLEAMKAIQEKRRDPVEYEIEKNKRRNREMAVQAALAGNIPSDWGSAIDPDSGDRYFFQRGKDETSTFNPTDMIDEMVEILEEKQREEMRALMEKVKNENA